MPQLAAGLLALIRQEERTDRRSGITNDPNRPDDPQYILRLVGRVITVSLETVRLVGGLPGLGEE